MTSFASSSLALLRRLLHAPQRPAPDGALAVVLDGLTAVAATEAELAEGAALGASYPAAVGARAWSRQAPAGGANAFGRSRTSLDVESPRGAVAAALGMALAGERATVFVSGPDLIAAPDLLAQAAGRHVPLVLHLAARAPAAHAVALGGGHEAYHAVADQGWFQLFAANVQEAVDLALIARRVAERTLVPGIVAMDGEQTALAAQEVRLSGRDLIRAFVGDPADRIEPPTEPQRLIFGDTRRRVPRWFDLEHPLLLSPVEGPETWALGAAGRRPFFDDHVAPALAEAFDAFGSATGRRYGALLEHRVDDATIVLVGQGAVVETLVAYADWARRHEKLRVGVLGARSLRPFPRSEWEQRLRRVKTVAVLERLDVPLAGESPLLRELRGVSGAARLVSVPYGLGGLPLRVADLVALGRELRAPARSLVYLGLDFTGAATAYPKRRVLADALRRLDPGLGEFGLRSAETAPDVRPADAVTLAIHRPAGRERSALAGTLAGLVHALAGGHLRTRPGVSGQRTDEPCRDLITWCAAPLGDPGDDVSVDIAVSTDSRGGPGIDLLGGLEAERSAPALETLTDTGRREAVLGAVLALFLRRAGIARTSVQVRSARSEQVEGDDALLDAFITGFESGQSVPLTSADARPAPGEEADAPAPPAVRDRRRSDRTIGCLARFWDQVGAVHRAGDTDELTPDPYLASGAIPPLTAAFRSVRPAGDRLPVFDPETCTGDGRLWTSSPDGSIAAFVLAPRALIDAGIDLAAAAGHPADALRSVAARLAKRVHAVVAAGDQPPLLGDLLRQAWIGVSEKMPEDRATTLRAALDAVVEAVGALPVARTSAFFDEPERAAPGTGELLTVVVDPDACKSPATILAAGEGRGLRSVPVTPESVASARRLWDLWHRLPDTSGATIERARAHPDLGPLAAMMLSRHCALAMASGDGAEAGSGAALALRRILAAVEFHYGPRLQQHLASIRKLREALAERIRDLLAEALPAADLDALAEGLNVLGRGEVDLAALSGSVESAVGRGRVDGARLARLVDAARGLADLDSRLAQGPDGVGRARAGLAIAPDGAAWTGVFPHNPFAGPVAIDASGETLPFARGLIEGSLHQHLAAVRLLRWARLELEKPGEAETARAALSQLGYADLDETERSLCPPLLVVGGGRAFADRGLAQLVWLLAADLPVKVVVLGDAAGDADAGLQVDALDGYPASQRIDVALAAVLGGRALVVQTSAGCGDHLVDGVGRALAFDGPALIHVHAPSPERHGFPEDRAEAQARLAIACRAAPIFTFDPTRDGVFGACLDLDGNPDPERVLAGGTDERPLTPLDWAATEERFAVHLHPLQSADPAPMPVAEYLLAEPAARSGRTPYVEVARGEDAVRRLRVDEALIGDADDRVRRWRMLQELAGLVTPFTDRVRETADRDVAAGHEKAIARLRAEYEERIDRLRAEFEFEATERVTTGLMALAGYAPPPDAPPDAPPDVPAEGPESQGGGYAP